MDVYRVAREQGKDISAFPFHINSVFRGYELTHSIENDHTLGQRIPGRAYEMTTVDDFLYMYGENQQMLDDEDYYFSSVEITVEDVGYDPWEDAEAAPETPEEGEGISQDMVVSVMYAGESTWQEIARKMCIRDRANGLPA